MEVKGQFQTLLKKTRHYYDVYKLAQTDEIKTLLNDKKRIEKYDFAVKHFINAKQEMQKHWKNTKFVVLFYDEIINDEYIKDKLKENNFIILDANELTDENLATKKYLTQDKLHPNEKAWDILVPKITKELNL